MLTCGQRLVMLSAGTMAGLLNLEWQILWTLLLEQVEPLLEQVEPLHRD